MLTTVVLVALAALAIYAAFSVVGFLVSAVMWVVLLPFRLLFKIVFGLLGAVFGLIGGIFGLIGGLIGGVFGLVGGLIGFLFAPIGLLIAGAAVAAVMFGGLPVAPVATMGGLAFLAHRAFGGRRRAISNT